MNDTRILPETGAVTAYVARVRSALADLPAEEADDLTQGMEADLTEAMSEGAGDLATRFGTPEAYAAELRSAAGLPPATVAGPTRTTRLARWEGRREAWVEGHPALVKMARDLVPAWWLARGLGAAYVVAHVFYVSRLVASVLLVAASLYLGLRAREDRDKPAWPRALDRLWNLGGIVVVPVVALIVLGLGVAAYGGGSSAAPYVSPGLTLNGFNIDGIYAYGSDGKRLDNVRLFASDGTPITVDSQYEPTPWVDQAGRQWTNVYPATIAGSQTWSVADPSLWHPPMAIDPLVRLVPQVADPDPTSAGAEGAPTAATPNPSATAPSAGPTTPSTSSTPSATAPSAPTGPTPKATATR